jgi:glycosyltransferase involved in cell wall biosynthesis
MKILVFNWQDIRNPLSGGAEVHLHRIFEVLASRGHEVTLFCSRFPGSLAEEWVNGIRVVRRGGRYLFNFRVAWRYLARYRRQDFDVVVDDLNKIPFFTPLFVRRPLVCIVHHLFGRSIFVEAILPFALYVHLMERLVPWAYRRVPVAAVSLSTVADLQARGIPGTHLTIVPNCVDHSRYRNTGEPKSDGPLVGYLGRLKKYKSIDHLVRAFAIVKAHLGEARLVVLGEGDARVQLERLANELGIREAIRFAGFVDEDEKVRQLQRMHVVANPSAKEGWGLTVIEANACGVPVVASDVPGLRDSVRDGETGLLYDYGDIEQLAEKLLLVLRDEHLRTKLSQGAIAFANGFRWEQSADRMVELLESTRQAIKEN